MRFILGNSTIFTLSDLRFLIFPGKPPASDKRFKAVVIIYYYSIGMDSTDFDDSASVSSSSSTSSVSNVQASCPYCECSLSFKYMFKHIHDCHYKELVKNTTLPVLQEILTNKKPLQVQNVQGQKIIGCLSCLKTFSTDKRALIHLHKDSCMKDHLSKVEKLMKAEGQVLDKDKMNDIWFRTLCYFLPHNDAYIIKIYKAIYSITQPMEIAMARITKILHIVKTEDRTTTNWLKHFASLIKAIEQLNIKYDPNVMGFMSTISRCKWLPDEKQLDEIMTERDVDAIKVYELKCVNFINSRLDDNSQESDVIVSVADFLTQMEQTKN